MGMDAHAFSSAQDVLSKSPADPSRTWRAGRPPSAPSGVPFSLVTFSWARKRKWLGP